MRNERGTAASRSPRPRFLVMGAGHVGCYLGGRLLAAGYDVDFVGRASLRDELTRHGLTLTSLLGKETHVPAGRISFETDARMAERASVVLLTVKSFSTIEAATDLKAHLQPGVTVVSFQNGVRNAEILRANLDNARVYAGMVSMNIVRKKPGYFHLATSGPLAIERGGEDVEHIRDAFIEADFTVELPDDIEAILWSKLLFNLNNALNAVYHKPLREQLGSRQQRCRLAAAMNEGLRVLRAGGIRPAKFGRMIPGIAAKVLPLPNFVFRLLAPTMIEIDPTARSSMWSDIQRGHRTEIDVLNGEIVALGKLYGIPTPINAEIVAEITEQTRPKAQDRRAHSGTVADL